MNPTIFIILSLIALFFLILGKLGEKKYESYFYYAGYTMFLVLGLLIFSSPLQIQTGETANVTNNDYTILNTYEPVDTTINFIIGFLFMIVGIFGLITYSLNVYESKKNRDYEDDKYY
jgi:amino acid transporter